jgi:hypothetical protein
MKKQKEEKASTAKKVLSFASGSDSPDLFGQTLRTVVVLVGVCVLFVGALSLTAVAIASKAMGSGGSSPSSAEAAHETPTPSAPKKPLSI